MVTVAKEMERNGFKIPLLIGGATTSKIHAAVKIAPAYSGPVIHVMDASKSVVVVQQLLSRTDHDDFVADMKEEYIEERDAYFKSLKDKKYENLAKARALKPVIDFKAQGLPPKPQQGLGTPVILKEYPLENLVPVIDWNPFFQVWRLRGKYPNRNYPKLFNDPTVGEQARQTFNDAQQLLSKIIKEKKLKANGICQFFPCNSIGDDIELYSDESHQKVIGTLYGIRQQEILTDDKPIYQALGDFIAPKESGIVDYIGMFAVTTGIGNDVLSNEFKNAHDDYNAIMTNALADRLAEAFAEVLHVEVRKKYWGYSPDETFTASDLHKIKYRGIRPAPGYPTQPDHDEKYTLWRLMDVEKNVSIELTESFAMWPSASVCGIYLANPEAKYFSVGKITKEQIVDYASRKGKTVEYVENLMPNVLID